MTGEAQVSTFLPRILIISAAFEPGFRGGGPARSVTHIVDTISHGSEALVVTRDRDHGSTAPYAGLSGTWVERRGSRVFYLNLHRPGHWLRLRRSLRGHRFKLLYLNSFWSPVYTVGPIVAKLLKLISAEKVLIAPRGELSPGALSLKATKKRIFLTWWGRFLRSMDVHWHATSQGEALDIRAIFPWARVEINENQTPLPMEPLPAGERREGPARLVFISRISPKKNLDLILRALSEVQKPVDFEIYGPLGDPSYWAKCQELITQIRPPVVVRYRGELNPDQVRRVFASSDAFIFPTLGENFGHAIAESLSASCPVICSDATPWSSVLKAGGGRVVRELTPTGLALEVTCLAELDSDERLRWKQEAGKAYQGWRAELSDSNILEEFLRTVPAK